MSLQENKEALNIYVGHKFMDLFNAFGYQFKTVQYVDKHNILFACNNGKFEVDLKKQRIKPPDKNEMSVYYYKISGHVCTVDFRELAKIVRHIYNGKKLLINDPKKYISVELEN